MITSKTSFIALIGNPVSHSLSPIMQNAALKYLGLDLIYIAIPCRDKDLELVLSSLKRINCKGLNITIPYKEKVFELCSEISPIANKIKAINTLKLNSEKEWSATNTDVDKTSVTPSPASITETSNVPPPKSNTRIFSFSLSKP